MKRSCKSCEWMQIDQNNLKQGFCRYDPPKLLQTPKGFLSTWPSVGLDAWCGKYEARINVAIAERN